MRSLLMVAAIMWGSVGAGEGVRDFVVPAQTCPPYTYCIWYLADPSAPSFLKDLKASTPDLFHLGYQIPFKGALGPTYGHELFTDDILAPDQVPREVERIQGITRYMRAAGVGRLIPYVFSMAFFGNPEKRTGFFHFYDHWDEYRSFGLGPKPEADPSLWSQVPGPRPLGGGPSDVFHYDPCINHPGWVEYLDLVVRQLASLDYNGMFFDVNTQYCLCPHCEEKFDIYLLTKYGRAGLREIFGTDDHRLLNLSTIYRDFEDTILKAFKAHVAAMWGSANLGAVLGLKDSGEANLEEDWRLLRCYMQDSVGEFPPASDFDSYLSHRFGGTQAGQIPEKKKADFVQTVLRRHFLEFLGSQELRTLLEARFGSADIRRRCCSTPRDLLVWVETQRFWCDSMAGLMGHLKDVGRTTFSERGCTDDFCTVANLGGMATLDSLNKRRVDGIDLVRWARTADMQMFEEMLQPGMIENGTIISNIFAFRWAMAAGTRAGTLLYKVTDDRAADLAEAEAAAGGGGAFIQGSLYAPESRKRWKRFFTEHADLWDGGRSWARVGVLFWNDQVFYEYPEHLAMVRRLVHVLSETQIPFDLITEEGLATLSEHAVVIAPMLRYVDNAQIETILAYAKNGGTLMVVDPFATEDKSVRLRPASPLPSGDLFQCISFGQGRLLRLAPDDMPKRTSDLWCLMEERGGAYLHAREYLNAARRDDAAQGVDLGSGFVARLEKALGMGLRWCPKDTDSGVYVHAYVKGNERVIVHAVNYHVPVLIGKMPGKEEDAAWTVATKSGDPAAARHLRITVPLPERTKVKAVQAFSPTDRVKPIHWTESAGHAGLVIDRLDVYQAVTIELDST